MILLKAILFLFIAAFVALLLTAWSFFNKVRQTAKRFQQQQNAQQTKVNGNIIIDQRTADNVNKKIIGDDEGEYVDYEE